MARRPDLAAADRNFQAATAEIGVAEAQRFPSLPPDLRDWVSADHLVHFIMDAVDALDLSRAR